jgi:SagB-type dehydrogenase family enzyme
MRVIFVIAFICILVILPACNISDITGSQPARAAVVPSPASPAVKLPEPRLQSGVSLEESLLKRRSGREYSQFPLKLEDASQLLWAAQGTTSDTGGRTAPSAGGLYPLEVYLVAGNIEGLAPGIYKYNPAEHEISLVRDQDVRNDLAAAALEQSAVKNGAASIVISAVYERTTGKYGDRGIRYVDIETGHAAQNLVLQAAALGLRSVTIGAFEDARVKSLLALPENESPLYIITVGNSP